MIFPSISIVCVVLWVVNVFLRPVDTQSFLGYFELGRRVSEGQ